MALLQKRPIVENLMPLYTLGNSQTSLIVGLGNPEERYDGSRHNIGFAAIDQFAKTNNFPNWVAKKDLAGLVCDQTIGNQRLILLKPTTYMNDSGRAVQLASHYYKVSTKNIIIIHDELDVDYGQIRTRMGGSAAGHNGIKSIINELGSEDFGRIKIGIGPKSPPQIDSADFVLGRFSDKERQSMRDLLAEVSAILSDYAYGDSLGSETRRFLL